MAIRLKPSKSRPKVREKIIKYGLKPEWVLWPARCGGLLGPEHMPWGHGCLLCSAKRFWPRDPRMIEVPKNWVRRFKSTVSTISGHPIYEFEVKQIPPVGTEHILDEMELMVAEGYWDND